MLRCFIAHDYLINNVSCFLNNCILSGSPIDVMMYTYNDEHFIREISIIDLDS